MPQLTISIEGRIVEVSPYIWRSYTGRRYIDGREAHGPVFKLGTNIIDGVDSSGRSVRRCECPNCFGREWRLAA